MNWETVIGLEIHVRLKTASKLFSGANAAYGSEPNACACGIDIALPGVLPMLNKKPVRQAVLFGLAIGAEIARSCVFARKNYFYPDLPKGYQISQYEQPIVGRGELQVDGKNGRQKIGITRAHLEEDAGRSTHDMFPRKTAIDFNRAGSPLMEIVSEPEMYDVETAIAYAKKIHSLVRWLGISDGNMEEGSFRCDANISLRPQGEKKLGTRAELKNINSFRFLAKALHYEIVRQRQMLESGAEVSQETRLFDPRSGKTKPLRDKEEAYDYRYFPDPDLLPVRIEDEFIEQQRRNLPELPEARRRRLAREYDVNEAGLERLFNERAAVDYFEKCASAVSKATHREVLAWMNGELTATLKRHKLDISSAKISPEDLAKLLEFIAGGELSVPKSREVFQEMWKRETSAEEVLRGMDAGQISDREQLAAIITTVLSENPSQVAMYRAGKTKIFGYFVGQAMKATEKKAEPRIINEILRKKLDG